MNVKLLPPWMHGQMLMRRFLRVLRGVKRHPARRAAPATGAPADGAECPDDNMPRGCGWFDSSHDLQQGCRVQEHLSADSLARELPLGAWLDLQLGSWRAATPGGEPPAFTHAT